MRFVEIMDFSYLKASCYPALLECRWSPNGYIKVTPILLGRTTPRLGTIRVNSIGKVVLNLKLSVVIPTLNEEASIGATLDEIPKDIPDMEVLIIDGASKDRTREIAKSKGAKVIVEKRKGYGRAYKTGFARAKGDIIVTLDGDTTYPACDIPFLVRKLEEDDLDFITCDRLSNLEPGVMNGTHRLGNWILKMATNMLFFLKLHDSQSGMWVFRRKILKQIHPDSDGMYRIRIGEIKLNTWGDGTKNLKFIINKRRSYKPPRA